MLALTREKLLADLDKVNDLVNLYQAGSPMYVERTLKWLKNVEQTLLQLRNPAASAVTAGRAKILAVNDGHRDPSLVERTSKTRKAQQATATLVLTQIIDNLQGIIKDIDSNLDKQREKMAQLLAVATAQQPVPFPETQPRHAWLQQVWNSLGSNTETRSMFLYLNASLTTSDRWYLLEEMLGRLFSE